MVRYAAMLGLVRRNPYRDPEPVIRSLKARPGAPDPLSGPEFLELHLFRLKKIDALPYLRRFTGDRDPLVRGRAALAMAEIDESAAAVPDLIALLKDAESYVRKSAIEALDTIGDVRAGRALEEVAEAHPEHRRKVRKVLARIER
jgi:HEAT repeat protein